MHTVKSKNINPLEIIADVYVPKATLVVSHHKILLYILHIIRYNALESSHDLGIIKQIILIHNLARSRTIPNSIFLSSLAPSSAL